MSRLAPLLQPCDGLSTSMHWPSRLWIVRHGESAGNLARLAAEASGTETIEIEGRDVDVPLSELGERQSRAVGRWLRNQPPSEWLSMIVSSPYARALQTMQHVSHELESANLQCLVDERLREKEFGELNRFTRAGILAR